MLIKYSYIYISGRDCKGQSYVNKIHRNRVTLLIDSTARISMASSIYSTTRQEFSYVCTNSTLYDNRQEGTRFNMRLLTESLVYSMLLIVIS